MRAGFVSIAAAMLAAGWLSAGPAAAASFDCATARAADEKTVCADCGLQQLDVKLSTLYGVITKLVAMGQRGDIQDAQRAWLSRRALCGSDAACVRQAYEARIRELEAGLSAIYARGPF
ncbi:lysozyme inhibitor LprI family protein [Xanthobacter sp. V2C-8]|uniref:lysozyme inhibitor LprI family protein n=1 Tax=Xanthobacter albus TaxID=3119929 RepID=UPI00372B19B9